MDKFKIFPVFLAATLLLLASCSEWISTEPRHAITDERALEDMSGIEGAVIGMYDILQIGSYYGRDMFVAGEMLADNAQLAVANSGRFRDHSVNAIGSGFGEDVPVWTSAYRIINVANLIFDFAPRVPDGTPARINQALGEAHFMRGLAYFDLLRIFARNPRFPVGEPLGVILRTTPFRGIDAAAFGVRSTIEEGYLLVERDLLEAERLLSPTAGFPHLVTRMAAQALLARFYLYWGRWDQAIIWADRAEASWSARAGAGPWLAPPANYRNVFAAAPGIESIWELRYESAEAQNVNNSLQGILVMTDPGNAGYGDVVFRADLLAAIEPGDVRGTIGTGTAGPHMIQRFTKAGELVHFTLKFAGHRGAVFHDDIAILRTSEVQLTLAEALAHPGPAQNLARARTELNELRAARGLPPTPVADAGLLDAIIRDRRIELMFEGHRWFDLARLGRDVNKPGGIGTNLPWDDFRTIMRIPLGERDNNPNLIQNPGY
ncbi:MAG TPA: hypothetical protein DCM62_02035 [Bacteroidales bacterium]|nr:hypothetical protein [Bacteroidales bacterium]